MLHHLQVDVHLVECGLCLVEEVVHNTFTEFTLRLIVIHLEDLLEGGEIDGIGGESLVVHLKRWSSSSVEVLLKIEFGGCSVEEGIACGMVGSLPLQNHLPCLVLSCVKVSVSGATCACSGGDAM